MNSSHAGCSSAKRVLATIAVVAGVALAAGCGSSAGDKGNGGTNPRAAGSGTAALSEKSSGSGSDLKGLVAEYAEGKPAIAVPTLSKKPASGIKVDAVICTLPTCVADAEPVPYQALGWKYRAFDYDVTKGPSALTTAFENAIQDHPKYIVLQAVFPVATFQTQLAAAASAGIKVVAIANPDASVPETLGCTACLNQQEATGALQTDVAVADGGTSAQIVYVTDPSLGPLVATKNGANAELAKIAPGNELHVLNVSAGDPPSVTDTAIANYVQQHSDVKYILFSNVTLANGVPQTLAQDGLASQVKLITQAPQATNLQQIAAGAEFASIAAEDISTVWRAADLLARDSVGDPIPAGLATPAGWHRVIDKANVGSLNGQTPEAPNYQEAFKKAWLAQS